MSISSITSYLSQILWTFSWQILILVILILFISFASRKASSNFKYWLWCIVLLRLCILVNIPISIGITHHFRIIAEEKAQIIIKTIQHTEQKDNIQTMTNAPSSKKESFIEVSISKLTILDYMVLLWITVVIIYGLIILFRLLHLKNHIKKSIPVNRPDIVKLLEKKSKDFGINRQVQLLCLNKDIAQSPVLIGIFHPKIILPINIADKWSKEEIEPILAHELVHIKRYDLLVNLLQLIFQVTFFFHPLLWYANWKIRELREDVCDDIAIQLIDSKRKIYSQGILNVLEGILNDPSFGFAGTSFVERKSSLAKRIIRILRSDYRYHKNLTKHSVLVLIVIGIISISISCDSKTNIIGLTSNTKVNVPAKKAPELIKSEDNTSFISLKILRSGEYEVEGVPTNDSNLENVLKETMKKSNKENLEIQMFYEVPFEKIESLMDLAFSLGLKKIYIEEVEKNP